MSNALFRSVGSASPFFMVASGTSKVPPGRRRIAQLVKWDYCTFITLRQRLLCVCFKPLSRSLLDVGNCRENRLGESRFLLRQTISKGFSHAIRPIPLRDNFLNQPASHGNRCDSVSAASDNMLSKGYTLKCHKYNYAYQILDKGGKWYLQVE